MFWDIKSNTACYVCFMCCIVFLTIKDYYFFRLSVIGVITIYRLFWQNKKGCISDLLYRVNVLIAVIAYLDYTKKYSVFCN